MKSIKALTLGLCILAVRSVNANGTGFTNLYTFSTLGSFFPFTNTDGANSRVDLVLSSNTLYGTTYHGGTNGMGTVFKINADGTGFTNLYTFSALSLFGTNSDGANPWAGLTLSGNTLYGTTYDGGTNGDGNVFKINTDGTGFTNLYNFSGSPGKNDGGYPQGDLILSGNTLYGTASFGTSNWFGKVFKINTDGTDFTTLYSFTNGYDGSNPLAGLILSGNMLYGTASRGGTNGFGTMFKMDTNGSDFTGLYSFTNGSDGAYPQAALCVSSNILYGTAVSGGTNGFGTVFKINTDGTDFTTLYGFTNGSDGAYPEAGLILSGNTLYGTTYGLTYLIGTNGLGTVFKINTDGTGFTSLCNFSWLDGADPRGKLTLSSNTLYGTTEFGGNAGNGTVFALNLPSPIPLVIQSIGNAVVLSWTTSAFALQSAPLIAGTYTTISNATSPYTNVITGSQRFFRLLKTNGP